ncbi:MAG: hypothetical protein GDA43_04550 [Hormoscilla sp. SP5CHS1]|nr:hypothetical protein [Hormoscilla sp. SP5CHS1]
MTRSKKKSSKKTFLTASNIVLAGVAWCLGALLFFLLFSADPPDCYSPVTYVFECVAYLAAAMLCLRNWQSPQIVSGRNVWLGIGLGMLSYLIGNLLFGVWELVWKQDPTVSPGNMFFFLTYVGLSWGMILAVTTQRLNLELRQWLIVAGIGILGIVLAVLVSLPNSVPKTPVDNSRAAEQVAQTPAHPGDRAQRDRRGEQSPAPGWVVKLENTVVPLEGPVTLIYTVLDVALLIAAVTLLLAFWGGRFSQSWRMIAAAAISLYIADMGFNYAVNRSLEYDLSTRSSGRRRRRS